MLASALHLDEVARLEHDDVGVHLGVAILEVREVEPVLARDLADRHGGDSRPNADG